MCIRLEEKHLLDGYFLVDVRICLYLFLDWTLEKAFGRSEGMLGKMKGHWERRGFWER